MNRALGIMDFVKYDGTADKIVLGGDMIKVGQGQCRVSLGLVELTERIYYGYKPYSGKIEQRKIAAL